MTDKLRRPEERRDFGKSLRNGAPLDSHAEWSPTADRPDPVALIEEQNETRLQWLVPVRRARMAQSPFTFYRGGARVMAADLARTPVSGITTQICGDAHLANFGAYASPERRLVFDINDFDETLPGPWEWDVKRLAVSFMIAGRHNGLSKKDSRRITGQVVRSYTNAMARLAEWPLLDIHYSMVEVESLNETAKTKGNRKFGRKLISKAKTKDSRHVMKKLAEEVGGTFRIRSQSPLIVPLRDFPDKSLRDELRDSLLEFYESYLESSPDHLAPLLHNYKIIDFAIKVVGVGSVGTRCGILMLGGHAHHDPLFLQIKEANRSVLEEHLPASRYANCGQRVVVGQQMMQTTSDIFLGWNQGSVTGTHYYLRQLKDWKASADVDNTNLDQLLWFAKYRAWTLARAHARNGDPIAISGYLGRKRIFERAVSVFAERYADQSERDYEAFIGLIQSGRLEAAELL
jgi:uncharacterized protein (DUF2252 family)